jgi:uncharacterized protein YceK
MSHHADSIAIAVATVALLAGCATVDKQGAGNSKTSSAAPSASTGGTASPATEKVVQVSDIPMPRETRIDETASIVIGSGDRWLGRLVMRVKTNAAETYNYYFGAMPRLGWMPLTAVQSKVSSLTFTNGDRVASMQIEGGVGGAVVTLVVSPRQTGQGGP